MIPITLIVGVVVVVVVIVIAQTLHTRWREEAKAKQIARARGDFQRQREHVEARSVQLAGASGRPRGLRWVDVDFGNAVQFARDRHSGQLQALVAVTIGFEAIEGGGMEEVEAVGNLRAGTAIFFYGPDRWDTHGRAIFNLEPLEAIRHFQNEMELVD